MLQFKNENGHALFLNITPDQVTRLVTSTIGEGFTIIVFKEGDTNKWITVQGTTEEVHAKLLGNNAQVGDHNNSTYWKKKYEDLLNYSKDVTGQLDFVRETNDKLKKRIQNLEEGGEQVRKAIVSLKNNIFFIP